jgi:methyl-accepting chemotaxis protein
MEPSKTKPEKPKNKDIEKNVESDSSMFSFTIRIKLILAILITSLVPLCALFYSLDQKIEDKLMEINENRLISLREEKKLQIEGYFQQINNQIATFSQDHMIAAAMKEFSQAFFKVELEMEEYLDSQKEKKLLQHYEYQLKNTLGSKKNSVNRWLPKENNSKVLQSLYISDNPNPIGKKHKLDFASDPSSYTELHKKYHPTIREYLERFGYYDIFLAEPKSGHIVYSVFKEVDFSTSLLNGPYAESAIGRVFKAALNSSKPDAVFF